MPRGAVITTHKEEMLTLGEKIRGVFAPVPTPFKDDGALDGNGWEKNITLWSASPLDGIVIAGSNGEIPFLSLEERESF